jgi:prophage antirepressor-like protein
MKQEMKIFSHEMFGEIRTMTNESGETFFVGKDVAEALGYKNPSNALQVHVDEEDKTSYLIQVSGSNYKANTLMLNESGLYSLVLSSKLPQAKVFKHWVTSEVLPQIRKTGRYELLPKEVKRLAAQADYCQQVLLSVSCYTMTQVAKEMSMTVYDLTRRLLQCGIIYYQSNQYMLYADFARKGYAKTRTDWRKCRDGKNRSTVRLVWTESGRQFLHDFCEEEKTRDEQLGLIEFC